jgi:hypothetical protein
MTVRTRLSRHFGATVIEGATSKRCRCWRVSDVTDRAVTRGRHMALRLPSRIRAVVTGRAGIGQCAICASPSQCRVVEARGKAATGLMAILAHGRRRGVRRASADRLSGSAVGMAANARLGLNGRILVIDRIGLHEITCSGVTGIAFPTIRVHRGVHGIRWMALGKIYRIIVCAVMACTATRCVGGVDRIHKWISLGEAAQNRAVYIGAIGGVCMTLAAVSRRGNVTCRP